MDIDTPAQGYTSDPHLYAHSAHSGHSHLPLPEFSASFPLPFRVLFLIGLGVLLWGSNLHILHLLGLDTAWILGVRDPGLPAEDASTDAYVAEEYDLGAAAEGGVGAGMGMGGGIGLGEAPSAGLHAPVYRLFVVYTAWVGGGWVLFRLVTRGETDEMERQRALVGGVMVCAGVLGLAPWRGVGERERAGLRRCLVRILVPSLTAPVFFADVILADVLTSFAKVFGDLYVSASQIWMGGITHGRVRQYGMANYITLFMVCLPYLLRLRQCLAESYQSAFLSPRPLLNSLKYLSALPVILLSAAQKTLMDEIAAARGVSPHEVGATRWHGEHRLFRLWLLAVVVNSMFSFWWDIRMDWGLSLGQGGVASGGGAAGSGGSTPRTVARGGSGGGGMWRRLKGVVGRGHNQGVESHQRSPCPTPVRHGLSPSHSHSQSHHPHSPPPGSSSSPHLNLPSAPFGLRRTLLLPDPTVYYLFIAVDLVLRFTWSLKLSGHLHTISEIESGVFMMEALELVRRWMWVFVRVEWEGIKMREQAAGRRAGGGLDGGPGRGVGLGVGLGLGSGAGAAQSHGARAEEGRGTVLWEKD